MILVASLIPATLTACGTAESALGRAAVSQAEAGLIGDAIAAANVAVADAREVKPLPADCNRRERSGVTHGDSFEVIGKKTDFALGRANDRVQRCYRLSEANRVARGPK